MKNKMKIINIKVLLIGFLLIFFAIDSNANRTRWALEKYDIDKLTQLSTYYHKKYGAWFGKIIGLEGFIHHVVQGDHIGKNNGLVIKINKKGILIEEIFPDGRGGWVQKKRFIKVRLRKK